MPPIDGLEEVGYLTNEGMQKKEINKNQELLTVFGAQPRDWGSLLSQLAEQVTWARARVLYDQPPTEKGPPMFA